MRRKKKNELSQEFIDSAVNDYLANGGKIKKLHDTPNDCSRKVYPEKDRAYYESESGLDEFNV